MKETEEDIERIIWLVVIGAGLVCCAWWASMAKPQEVSLKVQWLNDAVYYSTNSMAWDEERNKTNPTPSVVFYIKTVVTTNRVESRYFRCGDGFIELGAREDGVIVWRQPTERNINVGQAF